MFYNLTLLLPCTVSLFGASWLICKRRSNSRAQNILALCLLLSSVFFFCTANYIVGVTDFETYCKLDILDSFITLLVIPTMYLYFRSLTHEGAFTWKDYIWFLPAFVVGIGTCVLYLAMDKTDAMNYIESVLINRSPKEEHLGAIYQLHYLISVKLYNLATLIQIIGAGTCAVVSLKHYHYRLREFHSSLDDKSIDLDNTILAWFMLTIPFAIGIILPKRTFWEEIPIFAALYFVGWTIIYFGIFYYGNQQKYTVENFAKDLQQADLEAVRNNYDILSEELLENKEDEVSEGPKLNRYNKYLSSFQTVIEEEQIFLKNNLRADEVAYRIRTNRTYLSRMIKEEFQCTFSDYINRKRIEYATKLMQTNPEMKQMELAEKSGFLSASTFSKTFKQIMKTTPKEWMKKYV